MSEQNPAFSLAVAIPKGIYWEILIASVCRKLKERNRLLFSYEYHSDHGYTIYARDWQAHSEIIIDKPEKHLDQVRLHVNMTSGVRAFPLILVEICNAIHDEVVFATDMRM